ncbi:zinc ribbon domain-containing protein [Paenibacillus sp. PR3]|uniref:Zinc ribbon domain-containing protein n=1 Tax=Paenibacillus terricola TaxID=2763503 RepID=A0ABR8MR41_9BACL|nr:zinc ribbon domain-containing protein [Paenibacillus terricola]
MAVKICTNCGESNAEGSLICVICGTSLKDARVEGTPNADKVYSGKPNLNSTVCQHCNERLAHGTSTCKYCGTVVSRKSHGSRYYSDHHSSSNDGESTAMETFGRGCLWLILGSVGMLILAFITQSSITIPWFILIPIVIFVFWLASKKSRK